MFVYGESYSQRRALRLMYPNRANFDEDTDVASEYGGNEYFPFYPDVEIKLCCDGNQVLDDIPEFLRPWARNTGGKLTISHGSVVLKFHGPDDTLCNAMNLSHGFANPEFEAFIERRLPDGYCSGGLKFIASWEDSHGPSISNPENGKHSDLLRPTWLQKLLDEQPAQDRNSLLKSGMEHNELLQRVMRRRFGREVFTFFALKNVSCFNFAHGTGESRFSFDCEELYRMIVDEELNGMMQHGREGRLWVGDTGFLIFSFKKTLLNSATMFATAVLERLHEIDQEESLPLQSTKELAFTSDQGLKPFNNQCVRYARATNVTLSSWGGLRAWFGCADQYVLEALHLELVKNINPLDVCNVINDTHRFPKLRFVYVAKCTGPSASTPEEFLKILDANINADRKVVLLTPPYASNLNVFRAYISFTIKAPELFSQ